MSSNNRSMSFIEHLEELRWRIIKIVSSILLGGIVTFFFIDFFLYLLLLPLENIDSKNSVNLQVLSVQGMFMFKNTFYSKNRPCGNT